MFEWMFGIEIVARRTSERVPGSTSTQLELFACPHFKEYCYEQNRTERHKQPVTNIE